MISRPIRTSDQSSVSIPGRDLGQSFGLMLSALLLLAMAAGCGKNEVCFGTPEYWGLSPEEQRGPRKIFMEKQARRAEKLFELCTSLGTIEGETVGRQYRLWTLWTRLVEDDAVATDEILGKWVKDYRLAKRGSRKPPQTITELETWLLGRQEERTGSWTPPDAPLWLAVGEAGWALDLLARNGRIPELKHKLLFLYILQDPETAGRMVDRIIDPEGDVSLHEAVQALAWLPWLHWVTRDLAPWQDGWMERFRSYSNKKWLDSRSGGYPAERNGRMDILTTYRLTVGWNVDSPVLSWIPAPQAMAARIIASADSLSNEQIPYAAGLLAGSMADLDSLTRTQACDLLKIWVRTGEKSLCDKTSSVPKSIRSAQLLLNVGALGGPTGRWVKQFGCNPSAFTTLTADKLGTILANIAESDRVDSWSLRAGRLAERAASVQRSVD